MPENAIQMDQESLADSMAEPSGSGTGQTNPLRIEQMKKELQYMINFFPEKEQEISDLFDEFKEEIDAMENETILQVEEYHHSRAHNTSDYLHKFRLETGILASATVMENLQLSYDILDEKLKLLFLCFSIFPANSVIKVRSLIYWWIGEGLVTQKDNMTAEEVAKSYCRELLKVGMIDPINKNIISELDSCKIHPWIQHMLRSVAKRAGLFDFDENTGKLTSDFTSSCRAFLEEESTLPTGKQENLLGLFNIDARYLQFKREWFQKLKNVVVIQLGRWSSSAEYHIEVDDTDFFKGLRDQKQLRYLSLQGISRITELPDSIGNLTNVRILDLRACHNLELLPSTLSSMKKLTHLDVSQCYLLEYMPKGLQHLLELQVLKGFVISDPKRKYSCRLRELAKLDKLRKLSIYVGSNATEEAELHELKHFKSLRILRVTWGRIPVRSSDHRRLSSDSNPPQELKNSEPDQITSSPSFPPQGLEKLELQCFPRPNVIGWLAHSELDNLKRLYLRGGQLENLGDRHNTFKNIRVLRLMHLKNFKIEWSELLKTFPCIVYIEKVQCELLVSFPGEGVWEVIH